MQKEALETELPSSNPNEHFVKEVGENKKPFFTPIRFIVSLSAGKDKRVAPKEKLPVKTSAK